MDQEFVSELHAAGADHQTLEQDRGFLRRSVDHGQDGFCNGVGMDQEPVSELYTAWADHPALGYDRRLLRWSVEPCGGGYFGFVESDPCQVR